MKKLLWPLSLIFTGICILLSSCKDPNEDPTPTPKPEPTPGNTYRGIYILNQGDWNANNASISYYDYETGKVEMDIFKKTNKRGLGDTGNDLILYGSKLYCVVNTSELLEVMDVADCKSIKSIPMTGKSPRCVTSYQGKIYVSCQDGDILKIDTVSLEIEATAKAGSNPEGLCVANNKLYVANSGGLNYPNYGCTVSVFDLSTFTETKTIEVTCNPYYVKSDFQGDVYVVSMGNYSDVSAKLQRIDSKTDKLVQTFDEEITNFVIQDRYAYLYSYDYSTLKTTFKVLDVTTEKIVNQKFIIDGTLIETPYGIGVNPDNGDVFISDAFRNAWDGSVYIFSPVGCCLGTFDVGKNPSAFVFVK